MTTDPTQTDQQVVGLCRRLLRQNEDLHRHNNDLHTKIRRLYQISRRLGSEYRALRARLDQAEQDHVVENEASQVLLGAALDELASGWASRGQR